MGFFDPDATVSSGEYTGIVILNLFILLFAFVLDIIGMLLWMRKVRPNPVIGIRFQSMGDNEGINIIVFLFSLSPLFICSPGKIFGTK